MLGKEIRAGLGVVGTLLVIFCSVVFFRFSHGRVSNSPTTMFGGSRDLAESVDSAGSPEAPRRSPQVRFHPTIVKSSAWDGGDFASPGQVRTASADSLLDNGHLDENYLDDEHLDDGFVNFQDPLHGDQVVGDRAGGVDRDRPRPVPAEYPHEMVNPRRANEFRPIPRP